MNVVGKLAIETMPSFVHVVVINKFITGMFPSAASSVNSVVTTARSCSEVHFPTRKHRFVTDRGSFSLTERHQTSLLKQPQHHSLLPITYGDVSVGEETTISEEGREPKKARNA
ncbi:hypothetical protein Bca4012_061665 [Brassica carinata]